MVIVKTDFCYILIRMEEVLRTLSALAIYYFLYHLDELYLNKKE